MKSTKFLILCLLCSFSFLSFIPNTHAAEITELVNSVTINGSLGLNVNSGINNVVDFIQPRTATFNVDLEAFSTASFERQRFFYLNICSTNSGYISTINATATTGTITYLQTVSNKSIGSCQVGNYTGLLYQMILAITYNSQRDTEGINWFRGNLQITSDLWSNSRAFYRIVNTFITEYDQNVVDKEQDYQYLNNIQTTINNTNDKLDDVNQNLGDINDFLNDSNVNVGGLENSAGWLPAGPVDSILNLPLSLYENLLNNLESGSSCPVLNINLPFIDEVLPVPCLSDIFSKIDGLNVFWTWVGTISGAFLLFNYLLHLYKWVDDTLTLRENTHFGGY